LLTAIRLRAGLRRLVAIVCAVAFLTVGFGHSHQHLDALAPAAAGAPALAAAADLSPDLAKKAALALEHCHACTMIAIPLFVSAPPAAPVAAAPSLRAAADFRPHPPISDSPPPKSTI
jgi:hypothetical protein